MKLDQSILRVACTTALLTGIVLTVNWPLLGDSILMHYVVFLTRHGMAPYRDIAEMNLPFTYLLEQAGMAIFGTGSAGWRVFDITVIAAIVLVSMRLLRGSNTAAGLLAATLFAAVHLQDGVTMAGQRDLVVALLQLGALLCLGNGLRLFHDDPKEASGFLREVWWFFAYGLLAAAAVCIKPTAIVFSALTLAWPLYVKPYRVFAKRLLAASIGGSTIPPALSAIYLLHQHALRAFVASLHGLVAYHASIERRSFSFLIGHAFSPVAAFAVVAAVAAYVLRRRRWTMLEQLLALAAVGALASYLLQGKGFPYQRYPFLLFLLLLLCSRTALTNQAVEDRSLAKDEKHARSRPAVQAAVQGVVQLTALVLMVLFLARAARYSRVDPYQPIEADLQALHAGALSTHVQCMDTAGTCIGALYNAQLVQSTGSIYDCYFLDAANSTALALRRSFEHAFNRNPPRILVVIDSVCFSQPRSFDKYKSWPWFQQQLATRYVQRSERRFTQPVRYWSRAEIPYAYRIYERRD